MLTPVREPCGPQLMAREKEQASANEWDIKGCPISSEEHEIRLIEFHLDVERGFERQGAESRPRGFYANVEDDVDYGASCAVYDFADNHCVSEHFQPKKKKESPRLPGLVLVYVSKLVKLLLVPVVSAAILHLVFAVSVAIGGAAVDCTLYLKQGLEDLDLLVVALGAMGTTAVVVLLLTFLTAAAFLLPLLTINLLDMLGLCHSPFLPPPPGSDVC